MAAAGAVLVIKLGGLGDFVQGLGPCAAIRRHHAGAKVTLLTTAPFVDLARASRYFDAVWSQGRPPAHRPLAWLRLRRALRGGAFGRVYDLQTSARSSFYRRLLRPGPDSEWSGIARGCSLPHANPGRDAMHTLERQAEQLGVAGIDAVPAPDLSWARAEVGRFGLAPRYALLAPGGAAHRPAKRWPAAGYGEIAAWLAVAGIEPVLLGTPAEAALHQAVRALCPGARSLAGETGHLDIAVLARHAVAALGNDSGPMHLCAVAGCPSVVLFSAESDPALCAPRGPGVRILRRPDLAALEVDSVRQALAPALAGAP
jgi:ADP-heptose:LPS heptosyltransferase